MFVLPTGSEATFADLGHFSKSAIRVSAIFLRSFAVVWHCGTSVLLHCQIHAAQVCVCVHLPITISNLTLALLPAVEFPRLGISSSGLDLSGPGCLVDSFP